MVVLEIVYWHDSRGAHGMVSSLIYRGGLVQEMRRLKKHDRSGYDAAKLFLRAILSIPYKEGRVIARNTKRNCWYGLFSANSKRGFFKRLGVEFKSRKERIEEVRALRKHSCPKHPGGELITEMKADSKTGVVVPVRYKYDELMSLFPEIVISLKGGYGLIERWKERDAALDLRETSGSVNFG